MAKPIWENNPTLWRSMPLSQRLEILRKDFCTGPCGQSSSTLARREALDSTLKDAILMLGIMKYR